jgi:hypothetical protein
MADVEFSPDDAAEDLPEPPRRSTRPLGFGLAAVVAAAIGFAVAHGHDASHHDATPSATPTATRPRLEVPAPVTTSVYAISASDVLVSTGVFSSSGSLGSRDFAYNFALVNGSTNDLSISYPIQLVGPDDVVIPVVYAGIYEQAVAAKHLNDSTRPAHRLVRIPPGAAVSLVIRIHINCDNPAMTGRLPNTQPAIQVRLAGFPSPAEFSLSDLASGFDDAILQVCGS